LNKTKEEIGVFLSELRDAVRIGRYQISARPKNIELHFDYMFDYEVAKNILLDLKAEDFSACVRNEHPQYRNELLYIFGKEIRLEKRAEDTAEIVPLYIKINKAENGQYIIISLHKQEYPLVYSFK